MGSVSSVLLPSIHLSFIMVFFKALALSTLVCGVIAQSRYRPGAAGGASGGSGSNSFNSPGFGGSGGSSGSTGGIGGGVGGEGGEGGIGTLEETIPGVPGDDYPIFAEVPDTSFLCDGQADGGYYADPEAECQAFHICANDGNGGLTKYSFLCPNGTIFQQQYFVCDWWFNVDCSLAETLYSLNDQVAAEREANSPPGSSGSEAGDYAGAGGKGAAQGGQGGARGGAAGRRGGSNGPQAAASSPRGSYSSPGGSQSGVDQLDGADSGYGAPTDGEFEGQSSLSGYGRRRNARDLELDEFEKIEESIENEDF